MEITVGSYTGNGTNPRNITISIGGTPDSVMVRADAAAQLYWRTEDMATDESQTLSSNQTSTAAITALGSNQFTVNSDCNANGVVYYYCAMRDNGEGDFAVGSYTGNGSSQSINCGFEAIACLTSGDASHGHMATSTQGDGEAQRLGLQSHITTGGMTFDADGFDVGDEGNINYLNEDYYWMAWKADCCVEGSYVGNGADDRNITTTDLDPVFALTAGDDSASWYRFGISGDNSWGWYVDTATNGIQSLGTGQFQIGSVGTVNFNNENYYFIALQGTESDDSSLLPIAMHHYTKNIGAK